MENRKGKCYTDAFDKFVGYRINNNNIYNSRCISTTSKSNISKFRIKKNIDKLFRLRILSKKI